MTISDVAEGPGWKLICGDYREALDGVTCDALITDPPYSARTHERQRTGGRDPRYSDTEGLAALALTGLEYDSWSDEDVACFVSHWSSRVSGWLACMTSHDLAPSYEAAYTEAGRYAFAPIACVQTNRNVRLAGDGPASWTDNLCVARPRDGAWLSERKRKRDAAGLPCALQGAYVGAPWDDGSNAYDRSKLAVRGAKPLWLMRAIVRDYSEPGDLVCDPTAGGGTTLLAAVIEGRRAIGAERDPETFAKAVKRLQRGYTPTFNFGGAAPAVGCGMGHARGHGRGGGARHAARRRRVVT